MTRGTPALADRAPQVGDALGHYRLIGLIGDGSVGPLYLAEQRKIRDVSNTVALRCICREVARMPDFHSAFTAAAGVVAALEHPNILSIHEMSVIDGCYFLSMEYVPGEDVTSILTRCNTGSPVPPDIAVAIVKQAANAAHYFRTVTASAGRLLKLGCGELGPANLFVTYHGTVKWLAVDFPAPSEAGPAASGEHAVTWAGAYRAPEQLDGSADARADVFSLGALLWTFLTGHRPQRMPAGSEAEGAVLGGGVPPSSIQPQVPEALDAIVMRALSPEPRQRFQSARELSEALDRHLLQRDARPTHKHIRRWLAQLFDAERAALRQQIVRGRDVTAALAALADQQPGGSADVPHSGRRARELWSTRHSMFSRPERLSLEPASRALPQGPLPVSERDAHDAPWTYRAVAPAVLTPASRRLSAPPARPRSWLVAASLAACLGAAAVAAIFLSSGARSSPDAPLAQQRGQLEVRSSPEGAAVFVNGEPTGLRTPAVLKGLLAGRALRVRVEKAGFKSEEREVTIAAGQATAQTFELLVSGGLVNFAGVPEGARLFVDDAIVANDGKPVSLAVGPHALRVETESALVFAGTVVVVAGEQTIRVDGAPPSP